MKSWRWRRKNFNFMNILRTIDKVIHPERTKHVLHTWLMGLVSRRWMILNQIFSRKIIQLLENQTLFSKDRVTNFASRGKSHKIYIPMAWRVLGCGSPGNGTQCRSDTQLQKSHHSAAKEAVLGLAGAMVQEWLLTLVLVALSESLYPVRYLNYFCAPTESPLVVFHSHQIEDTLEDLASHADEKLHAIQFHTSSTPITVLSITSAALSSWDLYCSQQQILNTYYLSVCWANITRGSSGNFRR